MAFNLPDNRAPDWASAFRITAENRLEAYAQCLANASCLADVTGVEYELEQDFQIAFRNRRPLSWHRQAVAMCAQRRKELAATANAQPGATGQPRMKD